MSANIHGKMVYSFEKPMWHNITEPSDTRYTAEEVLDIRFGGGFPIHLRPVTVELNGLQVETGDFAIIRGNSPYDNTERVFGYCTDRYHPLQPRDVARCFDQNVREPAETMAFLGQGEDMFISWKMPSAGVIVGDEIEFFGIVRTGFDTLKGTRLFISMYRPVCYNTITLAEGWARQHTDRENNKGMIWRGKGVNKNLLRDLGYWMEHVQGKAYREVSLLGDFFGKLTQIPVDDMVAQAILHTAYPDRIDVSSEFPVQLREKKAEEIALYNEGQTGMRNGIFELFAGKGTAITPDAYGVMNATSEYFCHVMPSKKPIAESVMFGNRQKYITSMMKTLADWK